jgi:hypothetical protein
MLLVFTGCLTLNISLEVQIGVSYYVTSFYRKLYPENLDFQVDVQGKAFCKNK